MIEETDRSDNTVMTQNVWSLAYVDTLIETDRQAGHLDSSFGTDGSVTTSGAAYNFIAGVGATTDNKTFVVDNYSSGSNNIIIALYNSDGSLDTDFDTDGKLTVTGQYCTKFAVQSDGKIVILGRQSSDNHLVLKRYDTDGSLDTDFGSSGTVDVSDSVSPTALGIDPDGNILVGDFAYDGKYVPEIRRFAPDGSVDTAFGTSGLVSISLTNSADPATFAFDSDGNILVGGESVFAVGFTYHSIFFLARLDGTDGSLDTSFGGNNGDPAGVVIDTPLGDSQPCTGLIALESGKILASGYTGVARYNADGTIDTAFGDSGVAATSFTFGIALQGDGKIVAGGGKSFTSDVSITRLNADGTLDNSFGTSGTSTTHIPVTSSGVGGVAILPDGRLVAGQSDYAGGNFTVSAFDLSTPDPIRYYAQQDANYNTTALLDTTGTVKERYIYDPYGQVTVLNPDFTQRGDGSASASAYNFTNLHQGGRLDSASGLYNFRNRDYNPTLGRWIQQDPAGYVDGLNIYQQEMSKPVDAVDASGLKTVVRWAGKGPNGEPGEWDQTQYPTWSSANWGVPHFTPYIATTPLSAGDPGSDYNRALKQGAANTMAAGANALTSVVRTPMAVEAWALSGTGLGTSSLDRIAATEFNPRDRYFHQSDSEYRLNMFVGGIGWNLVFSTIPFPSEASEIFALRQAYVSEVKALEQVALDARRACASAEETARLVHGMRRGLGIKYKNLTPPGKLAEMTARNVELYRDPLGPTIEFLRGEGKTWEDIIMSSFRPGGKDLGF